MDSPQIDGALDPYGPSVPSRELILTPPILSPRSSLGWRLGLVSSTFRPIAALALRNIVLITVAMLLILVLLPAVLAAAGSQVTVAA